MPHHHISTVRLQGENLEELQWRGLIGGGRFCPRTHSIPTKKALELRKRLYQKLKAKKESE